MRCRARMLLRTMTWSLCTFFEAIVGCQNALGSVVLEQARPG